MNTGHIRASIATVAIMLSITTIGFAQATNASPMEPSSTLGSKLSLMADYLDLSDAQRGQVRQILVAEKPTLIPLIQQLAQMKQQIVQEVSSSAFDQAKISSLATQQSQTLTQLTVEKAKIMAEVFNILTPDQKAKAVGFIQKREARFQQQLQNAEQVPSSQQ
jgi:Spy/CpxP family protein refolding chaperone